MSDDGNKLWQELFERSDHASHASEEDLRPPKRRLLKRLRENLSKTRGAFTAELKTTLHGPIDDETWERIEELLITADVGVTATVEIVRQLETEFAQGKLENADLLTERLIELLAHLASGGETPRIVLKHEPTVILLVGVNGTGKTTTVGKLAWHLEKTLNLRVFLAAADTFRAAANEQLTIWAKRVGAPIVGKEVSSDPGAVAYQAIEQAQNIGADVVLVDTAGRLHTQVNLMAELAKVQRAIGKRIPGAPHEILLTIDATTGQNGLQQVKFFTREVPVTGIVLTKLDGSAKGGVALGIQRELGIPVKLVGTGESVEDLQPFDAQEFASALVK